MGKRRNMERPTEHVGIAKSHMHAATTDLSTYYTRPLHNWHSSPGWAEAHVATGRQPPQRACSAVVSRSLCACLWRPIHLGHDGHEGEVCQKWLWKLCNNADTWNSSRKTLFYTLILDAPKSKNKYKVLAAVVSLAPILWMKTVNGAKGGSYFKKPFSKSEPCIVILPLGGNSESACWMENNGGKYPEKQQHHNWSRWGDTLSSHV